MSLPGYPKLYEIVLLLCSWSRFQRSDCLVLNTYSLTMSNNLSNSASEDSGNSCRTFLSINHHVVVDPPQLKQPDLSNTSDDVSNETLAMSKTSTPKTQPSCLSSNLLQALLPTKRIQVASKDANNSYDAFLPVPGDCLGKVYIVSTGASSTEATHFVTVINKLDNPIQIKIQLGPYLSRSDITIDRTKLMPFSEVSLDRVANLISRKPLDGLELSCAETFAVIAGSWEGDIIADEGPHTHVVLEMLPPSNYFEKDYLVPSMPVDHTALLKILSLAKGKLEGSVTAYTTQALHTRLNFTLAKYREVFNYTSTRFPVRITANAAIMVVAYVKKDLKSKDRASSMTLIPPISKWTRSAILYPLVSPSPTSEFGVHVAKVVIRSSDLGGFHVHDMMEGKEVTSSLHFHNLNGSDYSFTDIRLLQRTKLWLHHSEHQTFGVIQFGETRNSCMRYALPVSLGGCLQNGMTSLTESKSDPNLSKDGSIISKFGSISVAIAVTGTVIGLVVAYIFTRTSKDDRTHHETASGEDLDNFKLEEIPGCSGYTGKCNAYQQPGRYDDTDA